MGERHFHLDSGSGGAEHLDIARAWTADQAVEMMHGSAKNKPEWYYRIRACFRDDCEPVSDVCSSTVAQRSDETGAGRGKTQLRFF